MTEKAKTQINNLLSFYKSVNDDAIITVADTTKIVNFLKELGNEYKLDLLNEWNDNFITKAELEKLIAELKAKGNKEDAESANENFEEKAGLYWRNEDPYIFTVADYNDTLITVVQTLRLSENNELEKVAQDLDNENKNKAA